MFLIRLKDCIRFQKLLYLQLSISMNWEIICNTWFEKEICSFSFLFYGCLTLRVLLNMTWVSKHMQVFSTLYVNMQAEHKVLNYWQSFIFFFLNLHLHCRYRKFQTMPWVDLLSSENTYSKNIWCSVWKWSSLKYTLNSNVWALLEFL